MQRTTIGVASRGLRTGLAQASTTATVQPLGKRSAARLSLKAKALHATSLQPVVRVFSSKSNDPNPTSTPDPSSTTKRTGTTQTPSSSLGKRYQARLSHLSERTGVPLPSLGLSFLVLHELTAIVPVVALYWVFAYLGIGAGFVGWVYDVSHRPDGVNEQGNGHAAYVQGGTGGTVGDAVEGDGDGAAKWKILIREWYEEGEKRVERVGRRYGILGYEQRDPQDMTTNDDDNVTLVDQALGRTGMSSESQSGAASKVADAIAAYVVVKVRMFSWNSYIRCSTNTHPSLAQGDKALS
ncbi:hypothetical protein I316_00862 [Kwoniella heveanensis BCC8398]|uniref:Uncharacterized protein n=1 Tax=Kwoniella heveanensis BCC8398 TaxID=1296120 RepID=A0A1B9H390_9TREE|nr:hypothetical protein I316_00862 [Kwoniella heveanensis BCC8398]